MNDDLQSYIEPELEARIVALVLGEASAFEGEELNKLITEHGHLQAYRKSLEEVHELLDQSYQEVSSEDWKLSAERRGRIFSQYTSAPQTGLRVSREEDKSAWLKPSLILACAACFILIFVFAALLKTPEGKDDRLLVAYTARREKEKEKAVLAKLDKEILDQEEIVLGQRRALTGLIQEYGIPYFDGGRSNPLGAREEDISKRAQERLGEHREEKEEVESELKDRIARADGGDSGHLRTKLDRLNRQEARMGGLIEDVRDDTIELSLRQHAYTQAKDEYMDSRERLEILKKQQEELRASSRQRLAAPSEPRQVVSPPLETSESLAALDDPFASSEEPQKKKIVSSHSSKKPAYPASPAARVIAASGSKIPRTEVPLPSTDFSNGENFGEGWGDGEPKKRENPSSRPKVSHGERFKFNKKDVLPRDPDQEGAGRDARRWLERDWETVVPPSGGELPPSSALLSLEDTLNVRSKEIAVSESDSSGVSAKKELAHSRQRRMDFETPVSERSDSTFSLNVSDVSFKLAKAALAEGAWPEAGKVRGEEFVNALDYGDARPSQTEKMTQVIEQSAHPFIPQRNLMRIAMTTASLGRNTLTPLRLTIVLDQSGSMEGGERAESVKRAFALLAAQLTQRDEVTLIGFARKPRLLAERLRGDKAHELVKIVSNPLTEGGTNLEEALSLGAKMARQQFLPEAQNRVILVTDGAANLGEALPKNLASQVESMRGGGIAFDACGVSADGLNDEILSALAKQGDGRYYFVDRPADADAGFARQIAGALRPAAKNVKVQVLFNPERVESFKLYGFAQHQLERKDFRDDAVDAAEMAAEESGVALYHFKPLAEGRGEVGTVSVRFLDPASGEMVERTWNIPYEPEVTLFSEAKPGLRLAAAAGLFAEKLKESAVGERVELKRLRQEVERLQPSFGSYESFREFKAMLGWASDRLAD